MRPVIHDATPDSIRAGTARVRELLEAAARSSGRSASDVTIVAAVKYVDAKTCADIVEAGVVDLAESRLDQLVAKQDAEIVPRTARWHWIGRLQSRQATDVAARCEAIHTLCTASSARRLAAAGAGAELLVQVNIAGDPAKDGLAPDTVEPFLLELPESLRVSGFMAMPPFAADPEDSRGAFAALRELRDRLAPRVAGRHDLVSLSMGTSQDFTVAVEEGATHVRLGRILYARGE